MRAFEPEAEEAFRFLVDEFGFVGPERNDFLVPRLAYVSPALRYEVLLETHEVYLAVQAVLVHGATRTIAHLRDLVTASGVGSGQRVFDSAQTVKALHKAAIDQAGWVRRLHPILVGEGGVELLERVGRNYGD